MSGHSKWSKIKHQKKITDARKSRSFSKLTRDIKIAVKEGGPDPDLNFRLRLAIQKAKAGNLPNDNIDRTIERASGTGDSSQFEELRLEIIGPENFQGLVFALTDNKNRTLPEMKSIIEKAGFKVASAGAVSWAFKQVGSIEILKDQLENINQEDLELAAIEAGAEDIKSSAENVIIISDIQNLESIKSKIEALGIQEPNAEIKWLADNTIETSAEIQEKVANLLEQLEEIEEFSDLATNVLE
jgi:YebC/PmpR family DNA-binding regulatory protein